LLWFSLIAFSDKGGIVDDHVILVPIAHYHSFSELPPQMLEEMETYISQVPSSALFLSPA
jgi:diadenosine tetraphosphate (Ap4A) HIT family hydrolase